MSGQDDMSSPSGRTGADREAQQRLSRRSVLRGAARAGVAGIAATALASTTVPAFAATPRPPVPAGDGANAATEIVDTAGQIVQHDHHANPAENAVFLAQR